MPLPEITPADAAEIRTATEAFMRACCKAQPKLSTRMAHLLQLLSDMDRRDITEADIRRIATELRSTTSRIHSYFVSLFEAACPLLQSLPPTARDAADVG